MKQHHQRFTRAVAAAALATSLTLASGAAFSAPSTPQDRVEARIQNMHAKLHITPAQEDQWNKVAQVMRDNSSAIEPLIQDRADHAKTMTAVDDLKSYGEITDAHADGIHKFTPVFTALYASMSDEQKKQADILFHQGGPKVLKSK